MSTKRVDIDWEYPAAADRGGVPADRANFVTFMTAVKSHFSPKGYGLTFTAPSSYWYLQHFDLPNLLSAADWVNIMTYDLHGVWDGRDPYIGAVVLAHTNFTEIRQTLQLFANVGVNPRQMVLGIGFYGRLVPFNSSYPMHMLRIALGPSSLRQHSVAVLDVRSSEVQLLGIVRSTPAL